MWVVIATKQNITNKKLYDRYTLPVFSYTNICPDRFSGWIGYVDPTNHVTVFVMADQALPGLIVKHNHIE